VRYQLFVLVEVLEEALAKAESLLEVVPLEEVQLEFRVQLLQQEVQAVLRQAQALQQLVALQQEQVVQEQVQVSQEAGQQSQQVQAQVLEQARRVLVEAEAQVEVLAAEQVRELVEVPLLEVE
jgi:flagellar biosynthesis/type III secretory pathway chaperone